MPRETFQDDLDRLRADVVAMGEAVLAQLDDALRALETADADLARAVIEGDDAVNERYLDLEARCVDLFALQQPVAGDLRFVTAAFKILTDLERVGDLATNLGQYAMAAASAADAIDVPPESVTAIGRDAEAMLADALDAFAEEDAEACAEIAARDDDLDVLCERAGEDVVRELLSQGTGSPPATEWDVEAALDDVSVVLLAIRDLERVGDHAVNVAARTRFMVENDPSLIV